MPRGYLGDREKTERTFPTIDGVRYVVAGDRARLRADGRIELLGRESVTINTGGEKVFAEEVELALKHHPAVYDTLVVGRPSDKWGQEVVAVVRLRDDTGERTEDADLVATAAEHIARYKLPKAIVRVDADRTQRERQAGLRVGARCRGRSAQCTNALRTSAWSGSTSGP